MNARAAGLLPLLLAALALGHGSSWTLALALLPLLVSPAVIGPRFDVDLGRQWLSSAIGAGAGYVLASLAYEADPGRLTEGWARLSAAALVAAAARATLIAPRGGYAPAAALGFVGLAFAGKVQSTGYPLYVVGFLLSLSWAHGGAPRRPSPRRLAAGVLLLGLALALGIGSLEGTRRLSAWAQGRTRYTTPLWEPRTGFSERMDLGALDGLLDSERRVLRVRGGHVDYLRGTSLDVYELGTWRRSDESQRESVVRLDAAASDTALEIEMIGSRRDRLFVPLGARALSATPNVALSDDLGSLRARDKMSFERLRLALGARDVAKVAAPRRADLQLPRRLQPLLTSLVRQWSDGLPGDATPEQVLRALEQRLMRDYTYSRHMTRPMNVDPLLDFLTRDPRGHCEYFASALTLLARAAGIPARVVMGYRVSERSPFGHYLVRERNAHAWVEAWLDGAGWSTRDATPESAQPYNQEHTSGYADAGVDALAVGYEELTDWLSQRTVLETSLAWAAGCAVLAVIVARGVRQRRRRATVADDEALLPFMQPLFSALARRGHARGPDEPIEQLADRVPHPVVADVLRRYAALRYGGLGDRDALARRAREAARSLRDDGR